MQWKPHTGIVQLCNFEIVLPSGWDRRRSDSPSHFILSLYPLTLSSIHCWASEGWLSCWSQRPSSTTLRWVSEGAARVVEAHEKIPKSTPLPSRAPFLEPVRSLSFESFRPLTPSHLPCGTSRRTSRSSAPWSCPQGVGRLALRSALAMPQTSWHYPPQPVPAHLESTICWYEWKGGWCGTFGKWEICRG